MTYPKEYFRKVVTVDINTVKRFMGLFYQAYPQPRRNCTEVVRRWENINCIGKKSKIIKELIITCNSKSKGNKVVVDCNCLEYLKARL